MIRRFVGHQWDAEQAYMKPEDAKLFAQRCSLVTGLNDGVNNEPLTDIADQRHSRVRELGRRTTV